MKHFLTLTLVLIGLTSLSAQTLPPYVPTSGLVGWWPFNGNSNDESGNGLNGTNTSAVLTTDRSGLANKAYFFDGLNAGINVNHNIKLNLEGNNSFTFSYWINPSSLSSTKLSAILSKQSSSGLSQDGFNSNVEFNSSSNYRIQNGASTTSYSIGSPSNSIIVGQWKHIVQVWTGSQGRIYLNGSLVTTLNGTAQVGNNTSNLLFGKANWVATNVKSFHGKIDDIGIWNRALTQSEITNLYNAVNCAKNTSITPQTNSITTGSTATFTALTADPNPSYVWQSDYGQGFQTLNNFGNYSGVNSGTLNIANVQLSEHNQPIRVISTSGNCIDTSNVAVIHILDTCLTNVTIYDTLYVSVTDTLIINATIMGINPPNNLNTLKVFPNPASTHITINYGNYNSMSGYTLLIVDAVGQTVFTTSISQQTSYIDLSTWTGNGIYFVHLIDPQNNTIENRKIIIQ